MVNAGTEPALVMPGLDPGTQADLGPSRLDSRVKPGHDDDGAAFPVMPGLDPGTQALSTKVRPGVLGGRVTPGHDGKRRS